MGNCARRFLGGPRIRRASRDNDVHLETNQFDSIACNLFELARCIAIFNHKVFPLDVTKRMKTLTECLDTARSAQSGAGSEVSYPRDFLGLLCIGG
jgi:hypothetical protein